MDNNNYYGNPIPENPSSGERKGMAVASLITGILSIIFGVCTGYIGVILGIVAIILGIFSKGSAKQHSGKAIAGIITGAVGLVLSLVIIVLAVYLVLNNPEFSDTYKNLMEYYNK